MPGKFFNSFNSSSDKKISEINAITRINGSKLGRCLRPDYPLILHRP